MRMSTAPIKPLILVAEDSPALAKMLKLLLERSGYEVILAADGRQAVELARQQAPDLMLLDIRMPQLDGVEALRQIRAQPINAHTPIVILTAITQRNQVVAAARAGASDFIPKHGLDIKDLIRRIGELLAGSAGAGSAGSAGSARSAGKASSGEMESSLRACRLGEAVKLALPADHVTPIVPGELPAHVGRFAQVKALPFVMPRVLGLTASHYSSADSLVSVIQQDVGLTGKVLAMANSSIYRRGRDPITSLGQAVRNIGFGSVRQAALGLGLMDLFHAAGPSSGIDRLAFWEHSFASGAIASLLAAQAGRAAMNESQAFVVGLLHNIGRLIFDDFYHSAYTALLSRIDSGGQLPADLESRWMGIAHTRLAEAVLREWHMPAEFHEPIGDHGLSLAELRNLPEPRRRWAGLVKLADGLATCLGLGDPRIATLEHIDNDLGDAFAVDGEFLNAVRDEIPARLREMKMVSLLYMPKANVADRAVAVSEEPLLYLCPRPPHVDLVHYFLQLRHCRVESFTNPAALMLKMAKGPLAARAVINLLPAACTDRTISALDAWAAEQCRPAGQGQPGGAIRTLVLAQPHHLDQLSGPFGQLADGLVSPVGVLGLERWLKVGRRSPSDCG
jgi:HD-like signal output (HDOD) protein/CheY-like chemotaxis protein